MHVSELEDDMDHDTERAPDEPPDAEDWIEDDVSHDLQPAREGTPNASAWIAQCDYFATPRGHRIAYRRRGAGPTVLMLHGFPTWSYDYAAVASELERTHEVVTLDFLGYGASDKPNPYEYSVAESADIVEQLASLLTLDAVNLVIHDYGSIVGQELLDRRQRGILTFDVATLTVFNCGLVYRAYRPTRLQKLLALPIIGPLISGRVTEDRVRAGLDGVRGPAKLTDAEFANLWYGISANNGHKLAHLHIRYNAERARNHQRWESGVRSYDGPVHLVWGMADPVSGKHVLDLARGELPHAAITELPDVGHFPMEEAPARVAAAMRKASR